jgi:hypothetical protein
MKKIYTLAALLAVIIFISNCKKPASDPVVVPPANPCLNKTILVSGTTTASSNATSNNGTISASATGSTGFTYSTNGTTFQSTGNFTSLAVGSYTVTAKDADGCTGTQTFSITVAACPTITVSGTTTPTANASASTGTISASATGSTGLTYSINGTTFQATGNFTGLAAGSFTVTAKDANGCTGTLLFTVAIATCPTITTTATPTVTIKCSPNTGTLTLSGNGGAAPYTYSINGGAFQTNPVFSTLPFGNVSFIVKDANSCTASGSSSIAYGPAGTGFTAVKNIMNIYCVSCHGGGSPQSGINFTDDCTIAAQSARIKARTVDLSPSVMPPSGAVPTAAEKAAITAWVTAGGKYNN